MPMFVSASLRAAACDVRQDSIENIKYLGWRILIEN